MRTIRGRVLFCSNNAMVRGLIGVCGLIEEILYFLVCTVVARWDASGAKTPKYEGVSNLQCNCTSVRQC